MTTKFKILSSISFIALAIVLTFVGVWALADLDFTVGGNITYTAPEPEPEPVTPEEVSYLSFSYNSSSLTAVLTGCDTSITLSSITIPAKILYNEKEYNVVSIQGKYDDDAGMVGVFYGCNTLKEVIIQSGVETIEGAAFAKCSTLTKIEFPNTILSIGHNVFLNCIGLTSITIPDSVTSIGNSAFYGCTSLEKVEVKATSVPIGEDYMFYNCPLVTGILVPSGSVEAYKSATFWKNYSTHIKAGNF